MQHLRNLAVVSAIAFALLIDGCSGSGTEPTMADAKTAGVGSAEIAWTAGNALAESTQDAVGGSWLASDSAAEACGADGARWGITRLGPGTDKHTRADTVDRIERLWRSAGYEPVRTHIGGDAPGTQLRYPSAGTFDDGFFIEFGTTEYGSTVEMQTPCAPGDADALNREKYGERHTNTSPDIPGTASPSASPSAATTG
ncbi:hypothetical protein [Curtobacterium sp. PhB136]|uniref:hypothetical protein n=1 Tax=Curtobacterium sp. PhB136 TaxID=2485181 RepID=UPI0010E08F6D|nr:hypothetical protein [Curtobacterium sp. PhB136]TCK63725.1 hypothetical protein EDF27_2271 [Curtobacterium sp. PhB136]